MAGAKKKKKPAANPARGFATTSIASKPRPETSETESKATSDKVAASTDEAAQGKADAGNGTTAAGANGAGKQVKQMTAEEFEKHLEESELQLLVEKHAQKTKRDAQRQRNRLETDRRLLRGQAEPVNSPRWLSQELVDYILELIKAESRFAVSSLSSETSVAGKMLPEEDMIARLWTLQQTLTGAEFPQERIQSVIKYVLDISPSISGPVKDSIWGLEEALDWMARECPLDELPVYEPKVKPSVKSTPTDSAASTRSNTPRPGNAKNGRKGANGAGRNGNSGPGNSKKPTVTYDGEIEPDELLPEFLAARTRLLELERLHPNGNKGSKDSPNDEGAAEAAMLHAKLRKIEGDVLFDRFDAEQQWKLKRVNIEKDLALTRKQEKLQQAEAQESEPEKPSEEQNPEPTDEVNDEAARIAAEILAENKDDDDDDDDLGGLFEALPQSEVDPETGKTRNVITASDGAKTIIRDFGEWTGVNPRRSLEEACRSRDTSVRIAYTVVSQASFASRHSVDIYWSKSQDIPSDLGTSDITFNPEDANHFTFTMVETATPNTKQSEAYVATCALFYVFSTNAKEEKVRLKLPSTWRDLWDEMAEKKKDKTNSKDREVVRVLRSLVRERQDQELEDGVILQGAFRGRAGAKNSSETGENGIAERTKIGSTESDVYRNIWAQKASTPRFQAMLQSRMQLPMWHFKQQVLNTVENNQVVIVCGETGCGKSTQVPAFLLEHELSRGKPCKIYCTEPRRISAISLARRVSEELGENKGELGTNRSLIGYSIRLEANTSRETRLVFATTGIVMRMLEGSNELSDITHLVLDEVHERSIDSDFLLIVLKRLMTRRQDLKVVLMSATVDAERFSEYLGGAPVLNVPGRTFPVQVKYLEDAVELTDYTPTNSPADKMVDLDDDVVESAEGDGPQSEVAKSLATYSPRTWAALTQMDEYRIEPDLIVQLIAKIASDPSLQPYSKAVLVFLPGIAEIRTLNDHLLGDPRFAKDWLVYPLHSTIATEDQEAAFLVPPQGMRKIVLATNIAETGITIPDVTCVIDTGKHREMRFDERRQLSRLIDTFISRANAKQRRGRAGRVQEGLCFHMFTKYRHDNLLNDQQTPEMLRLSLQDLAIRVKICKIGGIEDTLSGALDAPSAKNIRRAIDALVDVRALTAAEELTPLGHQLARLPLDVFLGKLILLGTIFKCLDMAITVAAILSSKSPFSAPFGQRTQADTARAAFRRGDSDSLTIYNAYVAWKRTCQSNSGAGKEYQFCRKNFLSQQTLANIEDLKGQLLVSLADSGFLSLTDEERKALSRLRFAQGRRRQQQFYEVPRRVNVNSDNDIVSASVIAWSFYPKLLVRDVPNSKGLRNVSNNQSISLHPSSVNRAQLDLRWLSYYHIMQSKTVYHAHETTAVEAFPIALLCGDVRCDMYSGVIVMDGNRARFVIPDWKTMLVIKVLRTRLRELLTRSFKQPGKLPTAQHEKWLDTWQRVFTRVFEEDKSKVVVTAGKV